MKNPPTVCRQIRKLNYVTVMAQQYVNSSSVLALTYLNNASILINNSFCFLVPTYWTEKINKLNRRQIHLCPNTINISHKKDTNFHPKHKNLWSSPDIAISYPADRVIYFSVDHCQSPSVRLQILLTISCPRIFAVSDKTDWYLA
jgi:hypothetical protein